MTLYNNSILFHLYYSTFVASTKFEYFVTQFSYKDPPVCFFNRRLHAAFLLKAQSCAIEFIMREASLYCWVFVHIVKRLTAKTMQSHASDVSRDPIAIPTDRRFSHSVTVPLSHRSHKPLHPVKTWHRVSECTVCILHICVCVHMCVYVAHVWVYVYYRAIRTCESVHKCHSGNHLLSQSNHILIAAVEDVATCSPTGSELQRVPVDLLDMWAICLPVVAWVSLPSIHTQTRAQIVTQHMCTHS